MIDLDDDSFFAKLTSVDKPIMVLFTSSFCGPSHSLYPLIDNLVEADDRFEYAEVDVEKCPRMTREYQVKGTPMLVFFKEGKPIGSRAGTMSQDFLDTFITDMIARPVPQDA